MPVPPLRIRQVNDAPLAAGGDFVLYWMIAFRRTEWNHALQRAVEWCRDLQKPLVVLEALRVGYPWASDRLHRFVIEGMADNAVKLSDRHGVTYYPYVEPAAGDGSGLLETLAERAAIVVTDDFPCFFLPRMIAAAGCKLPVRLEAIDGNGLIPLRATDHAFSRAFDFRRWWQRSIRPFLADDEFPHADPLKGVRLPPDAKLPASLQKKWPAANLKTLLKDSAALVKLPIDHHVKPSPTPGGPRAAQTALTQFLQQRLTRYDEDRNHPDYDAGSNFSPYLHFGHLSAHDIFTQVTTQAGWSLDQASTKTDGKTEGWWGAPPPVEAFLDQLLTWRELGYNCCTHRDDYDQYESLPDWAQRTLAKHATDPRQHLYSLAEFEQSRTHDPLWNAAQRQLTTEGRIHNYLRMLWGKKIFEWSATPQDALVTMIELNNKYALDGRNPNSYSGIFWTLGRYDRPWAPERPIFGSIRYMTSDSATRKLRLKQYLHRYGPPEKQQSFLA